MNQTITAYFSSSGTPATSLSPTIRIRLVSTGALVVTDDAMTEVGDGWYKYVYTSFVPGIDYTIQCDGTSTLSGYDRYVVASTAGETDLIRKILMNKMNLSDGSSNNWVLYDDDGSTPLLTFSITDKNGSAITNEVGVPARRGKGA
jgi:hypothetical protein